MAISFKTAEECQNYMLEAWEAWGGKLPDKLVVTDDTFENVLKAGKATKSSSILFQVPGKSILIISEYEHRVQEEVDRRLEQKTRQLETLKEERLQKIAEQFKDRK